MITFAATFAAGTTVEAEAFVKKFNRIERYLNGKMSHDSVNYDNANPLKQRWVKSQHIFKPEFYGSPDPRIVATSGTIHHRFEPVGRLSRSVHHGLSHSGAADYSVTSSGSPSKTMHALGRWQRQGLWPDIKDANAGHWQPIRGMGVTIYNDGGPNADQTRDVIVTGSCTAFESGSFDSSETDSDSPPEIESPDFAAFGPERVECARLGLWVDGVLEGTSVRRIFTKRGQGWVVKNFMWVHTFTADPGYHNIDFRVKVLERFKAYTDPPDRWWRIVVDSRSMVVDMQNFRETGTSGWPG